MKSLLKRLSLLIHSIRFRLALLFVVILGMVILLFSGFVYTRQKSDLRTAAITRLNMKVQRLAAVLRFSNSDFFEHTPLHIPSDPNNQDALLQDFDVLAFLNTGGEVIQSWGPLEEKYIPTPGQRGAHSGKWRSHTAHPSVLSQASNQRRPGRLCLCARAHHLRTPFRRVLSDQEPGRSRPPVAAAVGLPGDRCLSHLAVALIGGFWLADRAMRPVQQITDTARTIGETDLSRRLNLNRRDELGSWPTPSTTCSPACRRHSSANGSSPRMPATSCARR
jgi:hypothetical protein